VQVAFRLCGSADGE